MNKSEFIGELSKKTGLDESKCMEINSIIEDTFFIGKKNKEKIVEAIKSKIGLDEEEANKIYENAMELIGKGLKDKLKNPFKSQD